MKNSIQFSLKKPCAENFALFEKTTLGGFCKKCKKEVIDFSEQSELEVLASLNSSINLVCGRFKASQLNQSIPSVLKRGMGIACISLMALTVSPTLNAQNTLEKVVGTEQQSYVVKGTVLDDQNIPLVGVNVVLKGSTEGVVTDFDGKFEFSRPLSRGDVLIFSYIGFEPKEFKISDHPSKTIEVTISFEASDVILMGEISIDEIYSSKSNKVKKSASVLKK